MTTFLLIRHAHVDEVGNSLAGRRDGVHLSELGKQEARILAERLADVPIHGIYSSPLERALETATPLAQRLSLRIEPAEELIEFDFGDWTGLTFQDLDDDPRWRQFNTFRSGTRVPGGETMLEVQARAITFLQHMYKTCPDQTLLLVSHCDVIRAILCHYLGMPLDLFLRITIDPAALSMLRLHHDSATILTMNAIAPSGLSPTHSVAPQGRHRAD